MSDIDSIHSTHENYLSRSNSISASSNQHTIFERNVEENLSNTPMLMHHAQRRLSRANSVVSIANAATEPIFITSNSRSNSNVSNLYRTSSHASVSRRTSVISTHRHNENFIAPSLDSTCHIINDNNTTIDDIHVDEDHPLSSSLGHDSPISTRFTSNESKTSPGTSPTAAIKGPMVRRPSTIGLNMALGVHKEDSSSLNDQQSPPLRLNTFGFSTSTSIPNASGNIAASLSNSKAESHLAQGNSPRLVRFQSYADILSEESSSLRRPSFGSTNNSTNSLKPQTSQESLEFQFIRQPSLLKKPSTAGSQTLGSSPLSSPLHSGKQFNNHPLKRNLMAEGNDDIFEKVNPQDYRKFDSKEKSPFHQLLGKD
ncbi:hypothetical protein QEN19_004351 [Hanseniaspora menglaensis]